MFASIETKTNNFIIKTYKPIHRYYRTNKNKQCSSRFIASHFRSGILSQPGIKIREIQKLCRKELHVYVGKIVATRARNKVFAASMGDCTIEYTRIHDYCDEIERSMLCINKEY